MLIQADAVSIFNMRKTLPCLPCCLLDNGHCIVFSLILVASLCSRSLATPRRMHPSSWREKVFDRFLPFTTLSMETRLMLSTVPMRKRLKRPLPRIRRLRVLNSKMTRATVMLNVTLCDCSQGRLCVCVLILGDSCWRNLLLLVWSSWLANTVVQHTFVGSFSSLVSLRRSATPQPHVTSYV